jgi:hypothetical protein
MEGKEKRFTYQYDFHRPVVEVAKKRFCEQAEGKKT